MVYKKQIENTTGWKTEGLRKIINRSAEYRGVDLKNRLKKKFRNGNEWKELRINHTRSKWDSVYTGRCHARKIDGNTSTRQKGNIYLGVPKPENVESFDKSHFSQVVLHEIDHLLGLSHSEMLDSHDLPHPDVSDIEVKRK